MRRRALVVGVILAVPLLSGARPAHLGVHEGRLAPCPGSPNCVSSDAGNDAHRVAPLALTLPAEEAWPAVLKAVAALPRTHVESEDAAYLHAECRSALLGFVDDLELHLRPEEGIVAVRSASRLGYSDFGVNRRRVERLRESLRSLGVVR